MNWNGYWTRMDAVISVSKVRKWNPEAFSSLRLLIYNWLLEFSNTIIRLETPYFSSSDSLIAAY